MEFEEITEKSDRYENFIKNTSYSGFLQSYDWGEFKSQHGFRIKRIAGFRGGALVVFASILIRKAPFGREVLYIPEGPVMDYNTADPKDLSEFVYYLGRTSWAKNAAFLRIDPLVKEKENDFFIKSGFRETKNTVQPSTTLILDLSIGETEILKNMHQKARYNIRLAEKKGVVVREGVNERSISDFLKLQNETSMREKIQVHSGKYFHSLLSSFLNNNGRLFTAYYQDKPVSSIAVVHFGNRATYLYGGSSRENREVMGNHAAQWSAIKDAINSGLTKYDFWGVAETEDPSHPWAGITRFKKQFGGDVVNFIGARDFVLSRPHYRIYESAERYKKIIAKIIKW